MCVIRCKDFFCVVKAAFFFLNDLGDVKIALINQKNVLSSFFSSSFLSVFSFFLGEVIKFLGELTQRNGHDTLHESKKARPTHNKKRHT